MNRKHARDPRLRALARNNDDRGHKFGKSPYTSAKLVRSAGSFTGGVRTEKQNLQKQAREDRKIDRSFVTTGLDGNQPAGRWEGLKRF